MRNVRKVIGVCGARLFEQNAMKFLEELREAGKKQGYFPIAFSAYSDYEDDDEAFGEKQLFGLCQCANICCLVILTETLKHPELIRQIVDIGKRNRIPVFSQDGSVEGCYNLIMDYSGGFEKIVRHIVEDHKARYVNMLAGFKGNAFSDERIAIYRKVLEENGIPFEEERVGYGDFWARPTIEVVKKFLGSDLPKPEAILCANDSMAITACSVLKEEGYHVPGDIIVTGFDGIQNGKYHTPMLATCEPDYRESMEFIFQEIRKVEETGKVEPRDFMVDFAMTPSQSCGCEPAQYYDRNGIISTLFEEVGDCAWHNIAMNQMVTSVLNKQDLLDIAQILPEVVKLWSDHSHLACVKAELLDDVEVPARYTEMVTILEGKDELFQKPGKRFSVEDFIPDLDEVLREGSGTDVLIVRLLNSGRTVYGYIVEGFQELDVRRVQRCNEFAMFLAHSINMVLHNRKLNILNSNLTDAYNEISTLYIQDGMTGVYNRRGFYQKLDELLRQKDSEGKYLYIISVDMDGLKYINDTFGHAEGDFAIITMAQGMRQTGGEGAVCARFGGDEFVCAILSDSENAYNETEWSERMKQNISKIPEVGNKPYAVCASVGMSCCLVKEGLDAESMIMSADKKMYQDKVARKKQRRA